MNLAERWDEFTDEEIDFMFKAWNSYQGNGLPLGLMPFVSMRSMRQAIIEYPTPLLQTIQVELLGKFLPR